MITEASMLSPMATTAVSNSGGVDLLDGQHIGHIGLNGGQMRGPTGHKLRVLSTASTS